MRANNTQRKEQPNPNFLWWGPLPTHVWKTSSVHSVKVKYSKHQFQLQHWKCIISTEPAIHWHIWHISFFFLGSQYVSRTPQQRLRVRFSTLNHLRVNGPAKQVSNLDVQKIPISSYWGGVSRLVIFWSSMSSGDTHILWKSSCTFQTFKKDLKIWTQLSVSHCSQVKMRLPLPTMEEKKIKNIASHEAGWCRLVCQRSSTYLGKCRWNGSVTDIFRTEQQELALDLQKDSCNLLAIWQASSSYN